MKALKYIVWGILIFLGVFYAIPAGLLQVPFFQEKVSEKASEILHEKLGTEIRIQRVDFELLNKLILKDVYLEDQSGDTLFQAKRVAVGFEFMPLLKEKLRFSSAQIFSFQLNLNKETDQSPLNLQFVLDAFASRDTTKKATDIDIRIKNLNLRRGSFSYRVKNAAQTPGKFNEKDVYLKDLSSKIHLEELTNQQLIAAISRLSFTEQSGIQIRRLTFDLAVNKKEASIKKLELQFPRTTLLLNNIHADYSQIPDSGNLITDTRFNMEIKPSDIYLKDISPLVPVFSDFKDKISLRGIFSGTLNDLTLDDFYFQDPEHFMIQAQAHLINITSPDSLYIDGRIRQSYISPEGVQRMANNFSAQPVELPEQVKRLGYVRFNGNIDGYLHNLSASGTFDTDIGSLQTNIDIGKNKTRFIKGEIASTGLDLKMLMDNTDFGVTAFRINVDAKQDQNNQFSGKVNATIDKTEYKGYAYQNLNVNGDFSPSRFNGSLEIDSPEGKISANGLFVLKGDNSEFNFSAQATNIQLSRLNLTQKYKEAALSFFVDANFTGNNPDNLLGEIKLKDLRFSSEYGGYFLDSLSIRSTESENEKLIRLNSDIAQGKIRGNYSFKTLIPAFSQTLSHYLPSVFSKKTTVPISSENNFTIDLTVKDLQDVSRVFDLPFTLHNQTHLYGEYAFNKFRFEAYSPLLSIGKTTIESALFSSDIQGNKATVRVSGSNLQKAGKKLDFSIDLNARNDSLYTVFSWDSNREREYKGTLSLTALFSRQSELSPFKTQIDIQPSELIFNDSIWTLHSSRVLLDSGRIIVQRLVADHSDQFIRIDGSVSKDKNDQLAINLNKVDLEYIFQSLNIPALTFGGIATGYVHARDLYQSRQLSTCLDVTNFSFNNTTFGDLALEGLWDDQEQGILMNGHVFRDDSTQVKIDGIIYPVKEELSITFDAQNTNAAFLRKYLDNVVQNLSGKVTGKVRLFGNLNKPTVEGNVYVKNGGFGVKYLNTYYTFSDSVHCTANEIRIKDVIFYDRNGWAASATGYVKHKQFEDFNFSADLLYDNFLLFDATKKQNPYFYGTVYGSGSASIKGTESMVNIDVSMQNTNNTKISLNFMEESDVADYDFINFITAKTDTAEAGPENFLSMLSSKPILLKTDSETDIRFNLILDATPQATFEMIMDPSSGDKISGYGRGNMQVQYGTRTPLKIFGNYTIEKGKYNFSLQQAIFRNFEIQEGSTVAFRGDPYTADLDLDAAYNITANLGDLDQQLLQQSARNSVPVNCILHLNGALDHPSISFDIDLPGSPPELERQVKSYIGTEEMMNRQIVYLLILSRFYTPPEYTNVENRINNDFSFLTSTLSTQLSNMLGSISKTVQLGTRFNQTNKGSETSTEVELLLSSQLLNNRLIINGNFGYIDNHYGNGQDKNNMPLVGDFDVEYKLTPAGDIRLKGYNHYNYRNYYSLSPSMTQGIGIVFRRDFNSFRDILGGKKKPALTISSDSIATDSLKAENFIRFK